jgi:SAM-dependent methyltransferase
VLPAEPRAVDSVAYYDLNADRFAAGTGGVDMSALYERFLGRVESGGRILDAGCGVGRDALAFAERGYTVVAFDASAEMVRLARERIADRAEVLQMRFDGAAWREEFDGVWACASLLHVPATDLPPVIRRLRTALRPGGVIYMSFKHGSSERVVGGRRFTDYTEELLVGALAGTALTLAEVWVTGDVRIGRIGERWLNAIATPLVDVPSLQSRPLTFQ